MLAATFAGALAAPVGALTTGLSDVPADGFSGTVYSAMAESATSSEGGSSTASGWSEDLLAWIINAFFGIGSEGVSYRDNAMGLSAMFSSDTFGVPLIADLFGQGYTRINLSATNIGGSGLGLSAVIDLIECQRNGARCSFSLSGTGDAGALGGLTGVSDFEAAANGGAPISNGANDFAAIAPVPVPASGLLILGALGALGAVRRKRG
ncbi:VPLPA-CTERM sorting domain-containing protein [Primorskyibacter sp. 2E107]|uniref:VPLPA-CTERM sorting domain-containing protein n=1 Tax=Primorskyibacter sp. 2E107 TaxID=3403458 RepID=UPI003AF58D76